MKSPSPILTGFLQALGVVLYVLVIRTLMNSLFMSNISDPAPVLLLFCFSVLLCGSLVFARPFYLLFVLKQPKEAVTVFLSTLVSLGIIAALWLVFAVMTAPALLEEYGG